MTKSEKKRGGRRGNGRKATTQIYLNNEPKEIVLPRGKNGGGVDEKKNKGGKTHHPPTNCLFFASVGRANSRLVGERKGLRTTTFKNPRPGGLKGARLPQKRKKELI